MSPETLFRRSGGAARALRVFLVAPALVSLSACEWFTDFKRQPYVATWEADSLMAVRGAPQGSVPRTGAFVSPLEVSYTAAPGQLDSIARLVTNPTPISEASLDNGHKYYQHNCAVCHGDRGMGDGAATRYGLPGMAIVNDINLARSDGFFYAIIRNGRGLMPAYNRIEELDRWDVVNYIRALQGRAGGVAFATGPLAPPGVTGDKLPGATRLGPNRWVEHVTAPLPSTTTRSAAEGSGAEGAAGAARPGEHE